MNSQAKKNIRNKVRLMRCLVNILEYDIENLRNIVDECDPDVLLETLSDTKEILQNVVDIIIEMEYIIYLNKLKES